MIDARAARFRLSPSRLARFYFHECERHLRFAATPSSRRAAEGIPDLELDQSIVTKAILDAGDAWEERLLDQLGDRTVIADGPPTARASEQRHNVEDTVRLLRDLAPGRHLYQATLRAPAGFYEAYGLDPSLVAFVDCHPDLVTCIEGADGPELRVIDAKASDMMKLSHRIQVALYTLILRHVMSAVPGAPTVSTVGGVWLTDQPEPEWFSLAEVLPPLEVFLAHDLTPLLETPASEAFWHLYYRCEWCDYFAHCRREAEQTDDVSLVPYLSTFAKRHLTTSAGVATVQDLDELLASPDGDRKLAGCASLEGRGPRLRRQVEALRRGEALDTGHAALAMPVGEQVRLVVTLQSEPVTGACYGYALNRVFGKEIFDGSTNATVSRVARSGREADLVALRRHLVRDLMDVLGTVHDYNAQRADDWWAQKGLQSYVFDEYERELLVRELLVAVLDEEVGPDALRLIFHFHHPDLAGADDHPAEQVAFPVVVLMQVLRSAMALPSHVAYRFADAVAAVRPSAYAFDYRQDDFWSFELSNRLKSTAVMTAWRDDRTDLLESIEQELRRRVWAANSVINGIREHLQGTSALFAWPPKLMLPPSLSFRHPSLSRLAFIARYERLLGGLQQRGRRALPEDERSTLRDVIPLQATGPDTFRLMRTPDVEITPSDFTAWLLSRDDEEGRRGRLAFDDHANCNAFWVPKKVPVALAAVTDVDTTELTLSITPSKAFATPQPGERFVLEPRFTDFTTQRLEKELAALDQAQDPWFVGVIEAPAAARSTPETVPEVREAALALADRHGMTASQRAAFVGVLDNDLQLVWGPPGTGKTHFIALAVICLMEAHRAADLPFRVLLTACTHTALDNLLAKVRALADEMGVQELPVAKVGRDEHIQASEAATWASAKPRWVIGSTVWQVARVAPQELSFDLVLIDEGSQMKVSEAAIPVRRMASNARLVVVGDDRQLPPVVRGAYPEVDGAPLLHRSILECIRAADGGEGLVSPLLENWRMNATLCEFPRTSIYPPAYQPATPQVASRRLRLDRTPQSEFGRLVLDPDHPLTICVLEDVQATAANPVEAALVAEVVDELRGATDHEDHAFWAETCAVVSPHHAHIRLLRREIMATQDWASPPVIDTVDRMQGQERDVVIVSYGVADVEYALGEREFIYSLNRLNVAVTRGRAKAIVFLPRPLLEPPIQALDHPAAAEGIAFMQGLARWAELGAVAATTAAGASLTVLRRS